MLRHARAAYAYCNPPMRYEFFLQCAVRVQMDHQCQQEMKTWVTNKKSPVVLYDRIMRGLTLRCVLTDAEAK